MKVFTEYSMSISILSSLKNLGYSPVSSSALGTGSPLLEKILRQQLNKLNGFEYEGRQHKFSSHNLEDAFLTLKHAPSSDYNRMFYLLRNGKSYKETIQSDSKIFNVHYIDWENVKNNKFHVAREFDTVVGNKRMKSDVVLFVNGIPLVLIELKLSGGKHDVFNQWEILNNNQPVATPISFAQLFLSISPQGGEYNTPGANNTNWAVWEPVDENGRIDLQQDILDNLCEPAKLLDFIKRFIITDDERRLVARCHQFRAVEQTLKKIRDYNPNGSRKGGIISHPTGSGTTRTMIFLVRSLMMEKDIVRPHLFIVTDRIDMDNQIKKIFSQSGLPVTQALSIRHLLELLKNDDDPIITTVMSKFYHIPADHISKVSSRELFILVDEVQRGHSGSFHHKIHELFPRACYIGFSRTPFVRKGATHTTDSNELIHEYSLGQAVKSKTTLPILYEQRMIEDKVLSSDEIGKAISITSWKIFQQNILKFSHKSTIQKIAEDVTTHFYASNKGTHFKAMLVAPSQDAAVRYQQYFDAKKGTDSQINTAIVVAGMEHLSAHTNSVGDYFAEHIAPKYGNEQVYIQDVLHKFRSPTNDIELLIVVNHLLTGFDAPNLNTIYLTRYMRSHILMQTIARVNRFAENKAYGQVIDYVGVMDEFRGYLNKTVDPNTVMEMEQSLLPVKEEAQRLESYFTELDHLKEQLLSVSDRKWQLSQGEFLSILLKCQSVLRLNVFSKEAFSAFSKKEIKAFKDQLSFYEKLSADLRSSFIYPVLRDPQKDIMIPDPLFDHPLAIAFFEILKEMLKKKGITIPEVKIVEYSLQAANNMGEMATRDWQMSTKVQRRMNNYLEDSLLAFSRENGITLLFKEIDDLLAGFLQAAGEIIRQ